MTQTKAKPSGWEIPWMCNMHGHFRFDQKMMETVIPAAAVQFRHVTAMPNFKDDRIRFPDQAIAYKDRALEIGRKYNPQFDVNVPLYLEEDTDPNVVYKGARQGAWIAAKLYPKGGTTNSAEGVDFRNLNRLDDTFAAMAETGMRLLVHAEPQFDGKGNPIDPWDREGYAHPYIEKILDRHRKLWLSIEHASTAGITKLARMLKSFGFHIGVSIAPQYLNHNRGWLLQSGINSARYSIPVLQTEEDRQALVDFMLNDTIAFLGTDSAPHPVSAKSRSVGAPGGIFNDPAALNVYFRHFAESGHSNWLERFVDFACLRGPAFYGLPADDTPALVVVEEEWRMPKTMGQGDNLVAPMYADETMRYTLKSLETGRDQFALLR